jgi:hypothetical protein
MVVCILTTLSVCQQPTMDGPFVLVAKAAAGPQQGSQNLPRSPQEKRIEREQAKRRNEERQKKLKEDTDRLLQLATELKDYVDKTNENVLSLDVIRKSEEIEKLAKSVREKMKTYYAAGEDTGNGN